MMNLGTQLFTDMVTEVGRLVDNTSTNLQSSIKTALNNALGVAEIANEWEQLVRVDESGLRDRADTTLKTFVDTQAQAPMPWNARTIISMQYQDAAAEPIEILDQETFYRKAGASLNEGGRPRFACVVGTTAQYKELPASEILKFSCPTSTNANLVARIHYVLGVGHVGDEQWEDLATADWTTLKAMALAVVTEWPITRISLPSTWADTFNGFRNNGTTEIISIERAEAPLTATNSTQRVASRPLLRLLPVPDDDLALTVSYRMWHPKLTENEDQPLIPVSEFMVFKAAATIARQLHDSKQATNYSGEASLALSTLSRKTRPMSQTLATPYRGDFLGMTGIR